VPGGSGGPQLARALPVIGTGGPPTTPASVVTSATAFTREKISRPVLRRWRTQSGALAHGRWDRPRCLRRRGGLREQQRRRRRRIQPGTGASTCASTRMLWLNVLL